MSTYVKTSIEENSIPEPNTGCWIWFGDPYEAHRHSYRKYKGAIPDKHDVHHSCKNNLCVNPEHLFAVPHNKHPTLHKRTLEGTCKRGHSIKEFGFYRDRSDKPNPTFVCRACANLLQKRKRRRNLGQWSANNRTN